MSGDTRDPLRTGAGFDWLARRSSKLVGETIAGYRITGEIGRGGMGVVLRGERHDTHLQREVAIKVIDLRWSSAETHRRLVAEGRLLSTLEHPNIARIYDAGELPDGVPYLVMELVAGRPIHEFVRARRLSVRERVQLVRQVVNAVAFAHANLILHRDIKPDNVLVTDDGQVKLVDFGIAKPISDAPSRESIEAQPLTPLYASPEQVLGERITVVSDVYQLGLLLGSVLTDGRWPREEPDSEKLSRIVRREQLAIPAETRKRLPRQLTAVLRRCVMADPEDRYPEVARLGEDLDRYLQGYPVTAARSGAWFRLLRFVLRNRVPVAVGAVGAAVMLVTVAWYAAGLAAAESRATARAERLQRVLTITKDIIGETSSALIERERNQRDSDDTELSESLALLLENTRDAVARSEAEDPAVAAELLRVHARVTSSLLDLAAASAQLQEALRLAQAAGSENVDAIEIELAAARVRERNFKAAEVAVDALRDADRFTSLTAAQQTDVLLTAGHLAEYTDHIDEALELYQAVFERLGTEPQTTPRERGEVAFSIGKIHARLGKREAAEPWLEAAAGHFREAGGELAPELGSVHNALGSVLRMDGDYDAAFAAFDRSLAIHEHNHGPYTKFSAAVHNNRGIAYYELRRFGEARAAYQAAMRAVRRARDPAPGMLPALLLNLGALAQDTGDLAGARRYFREVLELTESPTGHSSGVRATALNNLGVGARRRGAPEEALEWLRQAHATAVDVFGPDSREAVGSLVNVAGAHLEAGRPEETSAVLARLDRIEQPHTAPTGFWGPHYVLTRARLRFAEGAPDEALQLLRRAEAEAGRSHPPLALVQLRTELARAHLRAGDIAAAGALYETLSVEADALPPLGLLALNLRLLEIQLAAAAGRDVGPEAQELVAQLRQTGFGQRDLLEPAMALAGA